MIIALKRLTLVCIIVMLYACAMLTPGYETPEVSITSFRVVPAHSGTPQFEIGLHIINPNRVALALEGISYTISIDDHKLLSGVSNQLPVIESYGEGDVVVNAVPDMLGSMGLISDLVRVRRSTVNYNLQIKLDVGSFLPVIKLEKTGEISLLGSNQW